MFGIGFQEMLVILVVVLIFFGPKRLPDLAKSIGKGIAEFKKASEEVRQGIQEAMKEETPPPPAVADSKEPGKEQDGPAAPPPAPEPGAKDPEPAPGAAKETAKPPAAGEDR